MYRQRLQVIAREASFPVDSFGDDRFVLSPEMIGELRIRPYADQWRLALANRWYHIKMQDHSIFLFSEGLSPSYSFIHCPIDVITFPEYVRERGEVDNPRARRELADAYQSVFDTASERQHVTPIRFDYDPVGYRPGVHPVAHVHIGLDNQIRLCSNKMNAVSFVLFVMRHMYPESWARLLQRDGRDRFVRSLRDAACRIEDEFWGAIDQIELHLR